MNPPVGNFANGAIWFTIEFKVSAFYFLSQKLADVRPLSKILSSILMIIIVKDRGFSNTAI